MSSPRRKNVKNGGAIGKAPRRSSTSGKKKSRSGKSSKAESAQRGDIAVVQAEPQFVGVGQHNTALDSICYLAVDYEDTRYHIGDHVALYAGPGKEWVCVIEHLFEGLDDKKPSFKGRWYWSFADVEEHRSGRGEAPRASKNLKHELISSDNRDSNLVEVITRKCKILSWKNFRVLWKKNRSSCDKLYFCERMYYTRAFKSQELSYMNFPGDPIPSSLGHSISGPEFDDLSDQEEDDEILRAVGDDDVNSADGIPRPHIGSVTPATAGSGLIGSKAPGEGGLTRYFIF